MESIQKGTPPPFGERKECLAPIIFRAKNTEKSRPKGKVDAEKFSEIFSGECFGGKGKPPILAEIEGEVLIMTKDVMMYSDAKIVELFGIARGLEFFEFIFVPKSLFDVLFCVVFMSCPHTVFEGVEFAERYSFLYSPNAYHHINGFDIVGGVVLRVVYLFHIPYQIYWCKDRKNPPHFATGRGWKEKHHNLFCRKDNDANIVDMNGKTKPCP